VVYPPIDIGFWAPGETAKGDYFLLAGRLVAYKEADTAVRSANEGGFPLVIAGSGPQLALLQKIARPNISFVEAPSTERMRELYRGAQALIVPGIEDFGMTMVEAQACGTPVVARKGGGAVEAVAHGVTGYLYEGREPAALTRAIADFDSSSYAPADLRAHVEHFKVERFDKEILDIVARSTLVGRGKAAE
jgi:glycosyltransferase involved in cell wall biosynthesis